MLKIAEYLDRTRGSATDSVFSMRFFDLVTWGRKRRFIGIVLSDDVLMLDYALMSSFRIKRVNLGQASKPIEVFRVRTAPFEQAYVEQFFADNSDNPFALWNMLSSLASGRTPNRLTQLPPLLRKRSAAEQSEAIARMADLAISADILMTFDRSSGLHRLIRKYDKGMFGHCAMVSNRKRSTNLRCPVSLSPLSLGLCLRTLMWRFTALWT